VWPKDFEIFADMLDILAVAPLHDVKPAAGARINLGAYNLSLRRRKQPFARGPRIKPGIEDALWRGAESAADTGIIPRSRLIEIVMLSSPPIQMASSNGEVHLRR
jgi:hypothetical protein